ncbi:MAG: sigma-54 interaction domain-containing protein [bacterium]
MENSDLPDRTGGIFKEKGNDPGRRSDYFQNKCSGSRSSNMVGKSKAMKALCEKVVKISQSEANVLIYGESGTGNELIARAIHAHSNRAANSFVAVDCVALPGTLLENELFGHEKGAFTGADWAKTGLLEYAHNGTLFLDEIVELDFALQAKLLRMLQEREFRRVGGKEIIKVNLRVVAATNKIPWQAVKTGLLREDLYYRLNVIPLETPPLRQRKEDIPILIDYYQDLLGQAKGIVPKTVESTALEALLNYSWPGNVRELQNLVENLISLVDGRRIALSDLPAHITRAPELRDFSRTELLDLPFHKARNLLSQEFEKEYFINLLKKERGNISKAAHCAEISRKTLYRIIEKYDLQRLV